jgi:oxalate decarboxylase/phosphoglucose isomerase-like protein (cupin superfamily)
MKSGTLVFVPRGVVHTVWNSGSDPVHGVILISPGDREHLVVPVESA